MQNAGPFFVPLISPDESRMHDEPGKNRAGKRPRNSVKSTFFIWVFWGTFGEVNRYIRFHSFPRQAKTDPDDRSLQSLLTPYPSSQKMQANGKVILHPDGNGVCKGTATVPVEHRFHPETNYLFHRCPTTTVPNNRIK